MTTALPGARLAIRVHGTPIPQGSKKIARRGHGTFLVDNNDKKLTTWRTAIADAANDATRYHDTITSPVRAWVRFTFTRPASHYRTGRNAHLLKDTAPRFPGHGCGDVDKLLRAVLDAITGPVIHDDTQVVDVRARKFYAGEDEYALDQAGVDIVIEEL